MRSMKGRICKRHVKALLRGCWCVVFFLIFIWLCWEYYHAWPIAMDSVGELFNVSP